VRTRNISILSFGAFVVGFALTWSGGSCEIAAADAVGGGRTCSSLLVDWTSLGPWGGLWNGVLSWGLVVGLVAGGLVLVAGLTTRAHARRTDSSA
jgi:hypothetical protein